MYSDSLEKIFGTISQIFLICNISCDNHILRVPEVRRAIFPVLLKNDLKLFKMQYVLSHEGARLYP